MTPRRRPPSGAWVLASSLALLPTPARTQEAPEPASADMKFVQGLRERGYHDLAREYIDRLREAPDTPADLKITLEYEAGRGLLDEAANLNDLERRRDLLEQARARLDAFARAHPDHPLASEATVQMARLLRERGETSALLSTEEADEAEKRRRLAEARASFAEARSSYDRAIPPLKAAYEKFGKFIPAGDPSLALRDNARVALTGAELERALVEYEDARTYPLGSAERTRRLDTALASFHDVYDRYRDELGGFFAHMWEGKCHEEKGELGPAQAIYNELMEHSGTGIRPLQRKVAYFRIIVHGKRGEHALAVDRAAEWLRQYPDAVRSDEGAGVRFELARNILAQLPELGDNDKQVAIRRATDLLSEVVRYSSPFKAEAVDLLKKYKPSAALKASALAAMSYDDAYSEAESAVSTHEWDRAVELLKHAVRKADPRKEIDKANRARYLMAFAYFMAERYYEADILAEHLVRHYPQAGLSPKASEIGMTALVEAYNRFQARDQTNELNRLIDLAEVVAKTWPDADAGDAARIMLGNIALGQGRYEEASGAFESVRADSARRLDALVKSGDAHWRHGLALRAGGQEAEADAEAKQAQELMQSALDARREARVAPADPGLITNVNALAEIHRALGRPDQALALLEPAAQALGTGTLPPEIAPLRVALLTIQLRAHIAAGQADKAIADMAALESAGGEGATLTPLYFELGRSLKAEMDQLQRRRNDPAAQSRLKQTRGAYARFLEALSSPDRSGHSYESLMFAAESLLNIGRPKEAGDLFDRVLKDYAADADFRAQPGAEPKILRARLRRVEALRKQGQIDQAQAQLGEVQRLAPRLLEPLMEQGFIHEERAKADPSKWSTAYNYWKRLAAQLERGRPRRIEYYEAYLRMAVALQAMKQKDQAAAALRGVMTLSPSVGSPEMKAKYQAFLDQLAR